MSTFTIPQTSLAVGSQTVGPFSVSQPTSATLTIDRTVAGGLNSLTGASVLAVSVEGSDDGGTTWVLIVGTTWPAGIFTTGQGQINTVSCNASTASSHTQVRVTATVSGPSPIVVAGTLVTT